MSHHFDRTIDRTHTGRITWRLYGATVPPLRVADMDFRLPEPVIRALYERVEHGVFGQGVTPWELRGGTWTA